uniref:Cell adhesion molecule 2-like n=1 Tax=Saccoglossus kowalevskii TaxID=10224 RepID=A0ABM0MUE7_SACKO|nr:PREDICTED: cell adhesion molecule 2-like [Saccoglossus kowalevskii]
MHVTFVLVLCLTAVNLCTGILDVIVEKSKEALVQTSVTLTCDYTPPSAFQDRYFILWHFQPEIGGFEEIIYDVTDGGTGTGHNQFAGRTSLSGSRASLTISRLELDDAGSYTCEVDFYIAKQEGTGTTELKIHKTPDTVDILDFSHSEIVSVNVGVDTEFSCHATNAKPAPMITWYKNDEELENAKGSHVTELEDGAYDVVSTLTLTPEKSDDNAVVKCESSQEPDIMRGVVDSDTIFLNISKPIC